MSPESIRLREHQKVQFPHGIIIFNKKQSSQDYLHYMCNASQRADYLLLIKLFVCILLFDRKSTRM